MTLRTVDDLDVGGRRVLLRADLNVPLQDGAVADDFRIRAVLPTLEHLMRAGARTVVCSHLGRPKGVDEHLRMLSVAKVLGALIDREVAAARDVGGPDSQRACAGLQPGGVAVIENLRFEPGETTNDPELARRLAALADCYVNDAFGASHRAHASIVGVPALLPSAAGFLLAEEVATLRRLSDDPPRPFVVILGGAKVADKLGVVRKMTGHADKILIGGGMCFTFLKARGFRVGRSLVDDGRVDEVRAVLDADTDERIMLPCDVVVAEGPDAREGTIVGRDEIPPDAMGLDVGPATAESFARVAGGAASLFWNGPMGVFENRAFSAGTSVLARSVASCDGFTVTGGGDTAAALAELGLEHDIDFMSTGGGASLELIEGRDLPGIAALRGGVIR